MVLFKPLPLPPLRRGENEIKMLCLSCRYKTYQSKLMHAENGGMEGDGSNKDKNKSLSSF